MEQPVETSGAETAPGPQPPAAPGPDGVPAITQAVEEVRQILESLEEALEQMEEVLRLVELAERQNSADEKEIESLRRALRKIQSRRAD